ncbi:hypothetical protein D9753_10710 [Streptomyces dangxiongensis]|uniref:Uncharacterized protein n=1 Tax=Streptomyces dangxiongensis TaxID=1442032 RepID=A0A3G2JD42_9ACTN|nr:hypothetical protein [Streptomyces dangxiongensis]AYN39305.1 hypothetical protein D9753_10710 [Streptomyces dangxiongensis]
MVHAIGGPHFRELGVAAADDARVTGHGWLSERTTELARNWPLTVHGYNDLTLTGSADGRRRAAHYLWSGLTGGTLRPVIAEVHDGLERVGRRAPSDGGRPAHGQDRRTSMSVHPVAAATE